MRGKKKKLFLLSRLVILPIAVTIIAYHPSGVYGADKKDDLEINKILQSGLDEAHKGNLDAAIGYFNKALSLDEKNSGAYVGLGNAYIRKGATEKAIGYFNKALSLDEKNSGAYVGLGNAYFRKDATEKAIGYFNKALLSLDENNSGACVGLGNAYLRKGATEKAIDYFNKAISLNEKNPYAYYYSGLLDLSLNKKESALEKHKILESLNKDLADRLYEKIQLRFDIYKLIDRIWPIRRTYNPYLGGLNKRKIRLYIHKDLSKYDGVYP